MVLKLYSKLFIEKYWLIAFWLFMGFGTCPVSASVEKTISPIPVSIDSGHFVKSSMYLRYSFEEYNEPFSEFKTKENSPFANQFKKALQDIRDQNLPPAMELTAQTKITEGQQTSELFRRAKAEFNRNFPPAIVGQDFDRLRVMKHILAGNNQIISWEINSIEDKSENIFKGLFRFKNDQQENLVWEIGALDEVHSLIDDTIRQKGLSTNIKISSENVKCDYEYAVPETTTTSYPVYFQFNGKVYDFNIVDSVPEPNDDVLAFYQQICNLFLKSPELLVEYYTYKSAQVYRQWLDKYPKSIEAQQKTIINAGRKVIFILDADPIFIVFYRPFKSTRKDVADVRYEYIVKESNDKFRLTNYNYSNSLSQFLNKKSLFVEPFLEPLLKPSE